MFMADIDQEKRRRNTSQLCDTTEYFFHFILITRQCEAFLFCNTVKSSVSKHFFNTLHLLYTLPDRIKIGKHSSQPAFCNEWHGYSFCTFRYDFLCLFFGTDKHDFLTGFCNLL